MATKIPSSHSAQRLHATGGYVYFIAALMAIGALVGGIVLITHSVQNCGPNPYDTSLTLCSGTSDHPFAATGAALLVGGLIQAFVVAVVARLCRVVADMKAAGTGTVLGGERPYIPPAETAFPYDPPGQ